MSCLSIEDIKRELNTKLGKYRLQALKGTLQNPKEVLKEILTKFKLDHQQLDTQTKIDLIKDSAVRLKLTVDGRPVNENIFFPIEDIDLYLRDKLDIQVNNTENRTLADPKKAASAAQVKKDFLMSAYGHATAVRRAVEKSYTVNLVDAILLDRTRGNLVLNTKDLNNNIREYQQRLLNNVIAYLENFALDVDGHKSRNVKFTKAQLEEVKTLPIYDNDGNYTNVIQKVASLLNDITGNLSPTSISADTLIKLHENKDKNREDALQLNAYNSWLILNNIDQVISSLFGKAITIADFGLFTSNKNKYQFNDKVGNIITTWRTNDDINVEEEVSNIVKLLVETTKRITSADDVIEDEYLTFNDFSYITATIKDLIFNPASKQLVFTDQVLNTKPDINSKTLQESLSAHTVALIKGKSLSRILADVKISPQRYWPVVYELLNNQQVLDLKVGAAKTKVFNFDAVDLSIIKSIYNGIFSDSEGSLKNVYTNSRTELKDTNYYLSHITQVADSIYGVKFVQYYQEENGYIRPRYLKDWVLDDIKRNTEAGLNTRHSFKQNPLNYIQRKNTLGIKFLNVNNEVLNAEQLKDYAELSLIDQNNVDNKLIPRTISLTLPQGTNLKITLRSAPNLKVSENNADVQNLIKEILQIDITKASYKNALKSVGLNINDLFNFALSIVVNQAVNNEIFSNVEYKKLPQALINFYGKDSNVAPRIVSALSDVAVISQTYAYTLERLAKVEAILKGLLASTQLKGGEGNTFNATTFSRLLGSHWQQIELQGKLQNSAIKDCLLVNHPEVYRGVVTAKEVKLQNQTSEHKEWNVAEFISSEIIHDFLGGFQNEKNNVFANKIVGFLPSVNSDKNTINRILIDLKARVKTIRGEEKPLYKFTSEELKYLIAKELGNIYTQIYNNIEKELNKVFELIVVELEASQFNDFLNANYPDWKQLLLSGNNYANDFETFNNIINAIKANFAVEITPFKFLSEVLTTYNTNHRNNLITLTDQMHYINDKGQLRNNRSLMHLIDHRFLDSLGNAIIDKDFWMHKNAEILTSLISNDFSLNINQEQFAKNLDVYLQETDRKQFKENWIDASGNLILGKVGGKNIISRFDLIKLAIDNKLSDTNYYINNPHALKELKLNPVIEHYNLLDYLFTQEYVTATVGTYLAHPVKALADKTNLLSIQHDEAARVLAQNKRNVQNTAAMHAFQLNLLTGIPNQYNVAIVDDIKASQVNVSGVVEDGIKPFDGATFVNPFVVLLENYSLGSARAGITKKQFVHFYNENTGSGGIIKTAGFGMTNDWLRNSPFLMRMMQKMTDGIWLDQNGQEFNTNVLKDYKGDDIVYGEQFVSHRNKSYKIKLEYVGNNQYKRFLIPVDDKGTEIISRDNPIIQVDLFNNITTANVVINSNYKLWQAFGGVNSIARNSKTRKLDWSETSINNVVEAINNIGIALTEGKVETQNDLYQPLKFSDVHYVATAGAVKQGIANSNTNDVFYNDSPLNFMQIKMNQAGIQLDKEHHADQSELSLMTQVISACASRGYTLNQATNLYKALSTLTVNGTKLIRESFSQYFKDAKYANNFEEVILNTIVQALAKQNVTESNVISVIATDLIEKARNGELLTFADDLHGIFPCSNNDVFTKLLSTISVFLTKAGIKQKIPGVLAVLTPSHEVFKLYDGKKYESILNNPEGLSPEEYLEELQKNAAIVYRVFPDGKVYFSNHNLRLERSYITTNNDNITEIHYLKTPKERADFKQRILNGEFKAVQEYVKEGRNLAAYDVLFKGNYIDADGNTQQEEFTLYDVDSIQNLFYIRDLKTLDSIYEAAVRFEVAMPIFDDFKSAQKYLYNKLQLRVQKDLFLLSPTAVKRLPEITKDINNYIDKIRKGTETVTNLIKYLDEDCGIVVDPDSDVIAEAQNFIARQASLNFVQINGRDIEVDLSTIDVQAYECIMPKTFATAFGLTQFDSLEDILNDENYFTNRVLNTYGIKDIAESNYSMELKRVNGDHVYLLDAKDLSKSTGLVEIPLTGRKLEENGKLYRTDINGEKMYELASHTDKIFAQLDENGQIISEIICTNNLTFYADHFDYVGIDLSANSSAAVQNDINTTLQKSSNKTIRNIREAIKSTNVDSSDSYIYSNVKNLLPTIKDRNNVLYQVLLKEGKEIYSSFKQALNVVAARIPAQSMQSFMPMKIVAFENPDINTAHVSISQIWLQGSDFDIDAVSLATYDVNKSGKLDLWSPYADLSSEQNLNDSLQLPFPTGQKVEIKHTNSDGVYINWLNDLYTKFNTLFVGTVVDTNNLSVLKDLIQFINKNGLYEPANAAQAELAITTLGLQVEKVKSLLKNLEETINKHNLYLEQKSERQLQKIANNFVMTSMLQTIKDPVNLIQAQTSVDGTTKPFKQKANESATTQVQKLASPGNFVTKASGINENHTGSSCIGIAATGMKSYFALTQYYNSVLDSGTTAEQRRLLFEHTIQGKTYHMLSNVRAQHYKTVFIKEAKQYLKRLDQNSDAAIALSAILSLATDNAKELCLAKLNAGRKALGMYIYALSIGVDFETVANIMTSPLAIEIFKLMEGNMFTGKSSMFNISQAFDYLSKGPEHLLANQRKEYLVDDQGNITKENVLTSLIKKVNANIKKSEYKIKDNNIQHLINLIRKDLNENDLSKLKDIKLSQNKYLRQNQYKLNSLIDELLKFKYLSNLYTQSQSQFKDLQTLALGAFEMKTLGGILKLNQGLPTKFEDIINLLNNFENILINQADELRKIDGTQFENVYKIDIQRFVEDEKYRLSCIEDYENIKHTFNILECITKVPHFLEYLKTLAYLDASAKRLSLKWRFIRAKSDTVFESQHVTSKKDKAKVMKGLSNFMSDWLRKQFLLQRQEQFVIPFSTDGNKTYFYDKNGVLTEAKQDTPIQLGTDNGDATYKHYFEQHLVSKFKELFPNNIFIQNLQDIIFTNAVGKNPYIATSLSINMLPKADVDRNLFAQYKAAFNELSDKYFTNVDGSKYRILDLFILYDMIAFSGKNGQQSLHSILQNQHDRKSENLLTKFEQYVAEMDENLSAINVDKFDVVNSEVASYYAQIWFGKPLANYSPAYIYRRDSDSEKYKLMYLETVTKTDQNYDENYENDYEEDYSSLYDMDMFDEESMPIENQSNTGETELKYIPVETSDVNYLDFMAGTFTTMQEFENQNNVFNFVTEDGIRYSYKNINGKIQGKSSKHGNFTLDLTKDELASLQIIQDGNNDVINTNLIEQMIINKLNC